MSNCICPNSDCPMETPMNAAEGMAQVLGEHYPSPVWCKCGWMAGLSLNDTQSDRQQTMRHVADALAAAGYGNVREAEEALECCREQRTDLRELVDVERERAEQAEAEVRRLALLVESCTAHIEAVTADAERLETQATELADALLTMRETTEQAEAKSADVLADLKALVRAAEYRDSLSLSTDIEGNRWASPISQADIKRLIAKHEDQS